MTRRGKGRTAQSSRRRRTTRAVNGTLCEGDKACCKSAELRMRPCCSRSMFVITRRGDSFRKEDRYRPLPPNVSPPSRALLPNALNRPRAPPSDQVQPVRHQRYIERAGLTVGAGHRDPEPQPHQLGEHLGPCNHRDPTPRRLRNLGVVLPNRGRVDNDVRVTDIRGRVPNLDHHAERLEPRGHRRSLRVRAGHRVAEIREQLRDGSARSRRRRRSECAAS